MSEQLFQIGIKGLIRRKDGKILLLKIPAWEGNPGYWDMPGGRMDPGETFEQTLRRELKEEIGYDYTGQPKQIGVVLSNVTIPVGDTRVPLVLIPYEVELPEDINVVLDEEEAFDWFSLDEASRLLAVKYPEEFCIQIAKI